MVAILSLSKGGGIRAPHSFKGNHAALVPTPRHTA